MISLNPRSELFLVFAMVELAIWTSRVSMVLPVIFGILPVAAVLLYWFDNFGGFSLHGSPEFRNVFLLPGAKKIHYGNLYVIFLLSITVIFTVGAFFNPGMLARPDFTKSFALSLLFYLPNAFWQQILVNGYFLPRIEQALQNKKKAIVAVGILFAIVHLPNPVLVPATLIGGMLFTYFFRKTGNIYALTVAHAVLAVAIMYFLPESWHHHLRIGPGFWNY